MMLSLSDRYLITCFLFISLPIRLAALVQYE